MAFRWMGGGVESTGPIPEAQFLISAMILNSIPVWGLG